MKKLPFYLLFILTLTVSCSRTITLVETGKPKTVIIIPEKANDTEKKAANVMQDYLYRISGAQIKILSDNSPPVTNEILIGRVNRSCLDGTLYELLPVDGFRIKNDGKRLIIACADGKGALYGVYTFLENYLGCRKYTSQVSYIPKMETIKIKPCNITEAPHFTFRKIEYQDILDPEFSDWHKLNNRDNEWGYWCHTFELLVPEKEYGKTHPEYYSFYGNKRNPGNQLCLSNPDVFDIVCANLQKAIDQDPNPIYWSVSQDDQDLVDDDQHNYCRCPECSKLDEAAGSPMGSLLNFINKVSEKFPDKIISTLSYQYSRTPPQGIIPNKNVNIMLCNIESFRHAPLEKALPEFCKDLEVWSKLTNNILLWDYVIQFKNLLAPFPNLRTLQPNLQLMKNNNVTAVFEQGNRQAGGEFAELRAYILSKLIWNTNLNVNDIIDDFLKGYYGNASVYLKNYIDLIHDSMEKTNARLFLFGSPVDNKETFLSAKMIREYQALFDKAEKATAGDEEILMRVRSARLPLYFSELEIARNENTGERGAFAIDEKGNLKPKPRIETILKEFQIVCMSTGVSRVSEWHTTPQEYVENYINYLTEHTGKPVSYLSMN